MDLLNENKYKKEEVPKSKKIVLVLLILSIIATIFIVIALIYAKSNIKLPDVLKINDKEAQMSENLIITDTQGNKYISIKGLSTLLGYEYYNGEYGSSGESKEKGYIKNKNLVVGFEKDSNKIYKYEEKTNLDYQYYELKSEVFAYNNNLYMDLADISESLNVIYNKNNNIISINTLEFDIDKHNIALKEKGYSVTTDLNNQKALTYGMLVVSKNGKWGVLDKNYNEVLGNKYSAIYFDEYNMNFIVSDENGRYGVLSNKGEVVYALKYDSLEILNYENMLYKVKNNGRYGVMKGDGALLTNIVYDDIGYPADVNKKIEYTLIIPAINEGVGETIVVKQNNKYGLVYLSSGEEFIPCTELDRIYSIEELGVVKYKADFGERVFDISEVINAYL